MAEGLRQNRRGGRSLPRHRVHPLPLQVPAHDRTCVHMISHDITCILAAQPHVPLLTPITLLSAELPEFCI